MRHSYALRPPALNHAQRRACPCCASLELDGTSRELGVLKGDGDSRAGRGVLGTAGMRSSAISGNSQGYERKGRKGLMGST